MVICCQDPLQYLLPVCMHVSSDIRFFLMSIGLIRTQTKDCGRLSTEKKNMDIKQAILLKVLIVLREPKSIHIHQSKQQ